MSVGNTVTSSAASIGTSAAQIVGGRSTRDTLIVQNVHATQILYIGASGVATTTGLKVGPGLSFTIDNFDGPLYGIADGAATDVRVLEVS